MQFYIICVCIIFTCYIRVIYKILWKLRNVLFGHVIFSVNRINRTAFFQCTCPRHDIGPSMVRPWPEIVGLQSIPLYIRVYIYKFVVCVWCAVDWNGFKNEKEKGSDNAHVCIAQWLKTRAIRYRQLILYYTIKLYEYLNV